MKTDVVIVGAGLAGLSAAVTVQHAGFHPVIVEGSSTLGGRVSTQHIDGYTIDAGFQVFNPAYPAAKKLLNYEALNLQSFSPGVRIVGQNSETLLGNPLRDPSYIRSYAKTARAKGMSSLGDLFKFGTYAGLAASKSSPDMYDCSALEALQRAGMSDEFIHSTLKPFLSGVFLEPHLETSRRFLDFVLEYFIKGTPALPAKGMNAIAQQLATYLHTDSIRLNTWAHTVSKYSVTTDGGTINAAAVILATSQDTAHSWVETPHSGWRSVTTWYHTTSEPVLNYRALLSVDGQSRGPIINTVPLSNVAPTYSPSGKTLIASSVLNLDTSHDAERAVKAHAATIYGTNTDKWELVTVTPIEKALPAVTPPFVEHRSAVEINGVLVAGDHMTNPSINGAMASGILAGHAAVAKLRGR